MSGTKMTSMIISTTLIFSGLMAGLFFSFSVAIMPGLAKLDDKGFISAMQSINIRIQNPVFLLLFMGILILMPVSSYITYQNSDGSFWWFLTATLIYFIGAFAVTVAGNIPLNNALAAVNINTDTAARLSAARAAFENKWNFLNGIRTVSAIVSFIVLLVGYYRWRD